jgi:hypothetical protein
MQSWIFDLAGPQIPERLGICGQAEYLSIFSRKILHCGVKVSLYIGIILWALTNILRNLLPASSASSSEKLETKYETAHSVNMTVTVRIPFLNYLNLYLLNDSSKDH